MRNGQITKKNRGVDHTSKLITMLEGANRSFDAGNVKEGESMLNKALELYDTMGYIDNIDQYIQDTRRKHYKLLSQ